ncbi:MAG: valine--tRNA ligase, partial [Chloroflexi bacterium]|nr:valine--tRNA ligase [Chloroflexota bacterium]
PIPIIADEAVELEFGTGALKVTPGHDPVDFDIGQRHGLPIVNIMNLDATLNAEAGPFAGMERYEARKRVLERLEADGLLEKQEAHPMSLGRCDRCDTIVEPLVSKQWFMRMRPLAERAAQAVTDGRVTIIPERFTKVYLSWMENIRDWCISRQLWWGHRIPVWYCQECGALTVELETPRGCSACGSARLRQDPDVLDTWFSSGLWPHSTLGWPHDTEDLRYFYPTTVMETGYDILFFWVARMVMMGLENTNQIPFKTVYLHGLVRDPYGAKMSKSRGNVVDPLKAIDEYGADALRFALTTGITPGNDTRLSPGRMEAARNFANKLWNASRFVAASLEGAADLGGWSNPKPAHREDRWVLSQFNRTVGNVNRFNGEFLFGEAQREQYDCLWGTFCDWYIELAKVRLRSGDASPLPVLAHVLEGSLRLLHPYMPFVTEELWQRLMAYLPVRPELVKGPAPSTQPGRPERPASPLGEADGSRVRVTGQGDTPPSIMVAPYPQARAEALDPEAEAEMELVRGVVQRIRNMRAEFRINPSSQLSATVEAPQGGDFQAIKEERVAIETLSRTTLTAIAHQFANPVSSPRIANMVVQSLKVNVHLGMDIDLDKERKRLQGELASAQKAIRGLEGRLSNAAFLDKAPEEVVDKERERLETLQERTARIRELLAVLG